MSKDVARALGAGGRHVTIADKDCTTRPLTAVELAEVEMECLDEYKDMILRSFHNGLKYLDKKTRQEVMLEENRKVSRLDIPDLPRQSLCDPSKVTVTDALMDWIDETFDLKRDDTGPLMYQKAVAAALDQGMLTHSEYKIKTDKKPPIVKVPYVNWWVSASVKGMLTFVYKAFEGSGITKQELALEMQKNPLLLPSLSREIDELSAPDPNFGKDQT